MSGTSRLFGTLQKLATANFQDRLVMTTSITLRRVSLAKCSGIWREFRERTMKFLYDGKCRKPLILQGFWGNKRNSYARVFKTASLWPLRYPSVYELPLGRYHRIFNFFRNIFRNAVFGCFRSARKVSVYKAFLRFCVCYARKFSRPPRYDHFDTSP